VPIDIRPYGEGDSIEEITSLLNRAYAILADRGLRFVASWQTPDMTLELVDEGTCLVALDGDVLVGTILLFPHGRDSSCEVYRESGVRYFGKFAVEPARRGGGIGRLLYDGIEQVAREQGATILACDTAEPATELIAMYQRWGFTIVGRQNWSSTNYESVVLAKAL
jgi:GNAT superfamily N-acetyltransferase